MNHLISERIMHYALLTLSVSSVLLFATCTDRQPLLVPATAPVQSTTAVAPPTPTQTATGSVIPSLHPMATYPALIDGTTTYVSNLLTDALNAVALPVADLGALSKTPGDFRMAAFGGGLTAGVRNGGLYREAQLTAFPNLVAMQMGIAGFASPIFGAGEANGTGFMLYSDPTAEYPRWKQVSNSTAPAQAGDPPVLSAYKSTDPIRNYAVPQGFSLLDTWVPNVDYDNGTGHKWQNWQLYQWRYMSSEKSQKAGILDYAVQQQPFDFFIYEGRIDGWMAAILKNNSLSPFNFINDINNLGTTINDGVAEQMSKRGVLKGVIFTMPDYRDMAFMSWYPTAKLKQKATSIDITYTRNGYASPIKLDPNSDFRLMPTAAVAELFGSLKQGDVVNVSLTDADVMDEVEVRSPTPELYNTFVRRTAQKYNLALVDLNVLYHSIQQGAYRTDDGLQLDGSPKGNFFSSDGINPTGVGQAVIANEVIRAINTTYQARIPLINVRNFVQKTGVR